jgi:hypothetical protein
MVELSLDDLLRSMSAATDADFLINHLYTSINTYAPADQNSSTLPTNRAH